MSCADRAKLDPYSQVEYIRLPRDSGQQMGILQGPRAKLERAQDQTEALLNELGLVVRPESDPIVPQFGARPYKPPPGMNGTVWVVSVRAGEIPSLPADYGIRLGEALHNFRGALDHAVWRLVTASKVKLTASQRRAVQFPTVAKSADYWKEVSRRCPGVPKDIRDLFEQYQPYRRQLGRPIRHLRDLTNVDKHRTLIVTPSYLGNINLDLGWSECSKIGDRQLVKAGRQIKRGTPLGEIALLCEGDAKPKVTVRGKVELAPAFPPSILSPYAGRIPVAVRLALNGIRQTCEEILSGIETRL